MYACPSHSCALRRRPSHDFLHLRSGSIADDPEEGACGLQSKAICLEIVDDQAVCCGMYRHRARLASILGTFRYERDRVSFEAHTTSSPVPPNHMFCDLRVA